MVESTLIVLVKFDYVAREEHELSIRKNERLRVLDATHNWWKVRKQEGAPTITTPRLQVIDQRGQKGLVPSNHLRKESLVDKMSETLGFANRRSKVSQTLNVSEDRHPEALDAASYGDFDDTTNVRRLTNLAASLKKLYSSSQRS